VEERLVGEEQLGHGFRAGLGVRADEEEVVASSREERQLLDALNQAEAEARGGHHDALLRLGQTTQRVHRIPCMLVARSQQRHERREQIRQHQEEDFINLQAR
jgi:hypothetical protein